MTTWLPIIASSAGGAAVTLLGVAAGAFMASRSQTRQWIRDKQIGACTAIVEESTQMQLVLLRQQRHGHQADWTAWNQALAGVWLVSIPEVINAAAKMDRVFWVNGTRIKAGLMTDEDAWALAREQMESARLDFINAARRYVVRSLVPVTDLPAARPRLPNSSRFRSPPPIPTPWTKLRSRRQLIMSERAVMPRRVLTDEARLMPPSAGQLDTPGPVGSGTILLAIPWFGRRFEPLEAQGCQRRRERDGMPRNVHERRQRHNW